MKNLFRKVRFYGRDKTIHQTTELDVETDKNGKVVAVWFRCQALPFQQVTVEKDRALRMETMYKDGEIPYLLGVDVEDPDD
jgi:hypothetical protein